MKGKWKKQDNHIVLIVSDQVFHPNAEEIFKFANNGGTCHIEDIECEPLLNTFSEIRFSRVGADIRCILETDEQNVIFFKTYCYRGDKRIDVDIVQGKVIDHCLTDEEWFYLTGNVDEMNAMLEKTKIKENGKITIFQYVKFIRNKHLFSSGTLINSVKTDILDKPIDDKGKLPYGLDAKLYDYQKTGYFWMRYMLLENNGCILGDEMGLGKTLQVITLMLDYKNHKRVPMLVVTPVSLLQNWKRECEKFAPSLNIFIHHGKKRTGRYKDLQKYDIVIISYNTAVSDTSVLRMIAWKLVVLDEAQSIKNPDSNRTIYVKKIPRQTCVAISGTPFENHVTDIWSLVDFVMPGLLGTKNEYISYISDDVEGANKLEPLLSPIMIRRRVADVATDLPEKIVIPQPIIMSDIECMKYEDYRRLTSDDVKNGAIDLAVLQKLRMYCTHPSLCEDEKNDPFSSSVKYQRMCEILEQIISRREKTILFTSYHRMFDVLESDIPDRFGIPVFKINGSTPVEIRQEIVDQFNIFEGSALLALNPRAAGTGLNVTAANHVIHYNLEWNPALEDQASARVYRRGQEKTVFVYRLYYEGTVEQIVNERIEHKREIAETAIIGTDGKSENREDIIAALTISPIGQKNREEI